MILSIGRCILLILCFLALSCGNNKDKERAGEVKETVLSEDEITSIQRQREDSLYSVVMGIHDEIMPKMQDIFNIKTALEDKLSNSDINNDSLVLIIDELEQAEVGMMNWMRSFRPDKTVGHDSLMQYYRSEKEKIEIVKGEIETFLEKAKSMKD